jgi:hypothetical protein
VPKRFFKIKSNFINKLPKQRLSDAPKMNAIHRRHLCRLGKKTNTERETAFLRQNAQWVAQITCNPAAGGADGIVRVPIGTRGQGERFNVPMVFSIRFLRLLAPADHLGYRLILQNISSPKR